MEHLQWLLLEFNLSQPETWVSQNYGSQWYSEYKLTLVSFCNSKPWSFYLSSKYNVGFKYIMIYDVFASWIW